MWDDSWEVIDPNYGPHGWEIFSSLGPDQELFGGPWAHRRVKF